MNEKTNSTPEPLAAIGNEENGDKFLPVLDSNQMPDFSEFLTSSKVERLDSMKKTFSIVPTYVEIEKKPFRGIFCGVTEQSYQKVDESTGEVKTLTGKVVTLARDGKIFVNRGIQLIATFVDSKVAAGTAVEIVLHESKTNKHGGKTKIYDVVILKP